jgi:metallo-beta-lactamase class B
MVYDRGGLTGMAKANWTAPFPGHRIIGPLFSVGTEGLGMYVLTSDDGHILINTGVEGSARLIHHNMESLGLRFEDIRILLTMQSHNDHATELALIKQSVGADMWAVEADTRVLEDGGLSDPQFGGRQIFPPIHVDRALHHGDTVTIGDIDLSVHEHPGHTEGSCSYSLVVTEGGNAYNVVIANMATINKGKRLLVDPTYPNVATDFATTFRRQKAMDVDIWVSAHANHYSLHEKYSPGQPYDPTRFVDPAGFHGKVAQLEAAFIAQLSQESHKVDTRIGADDLIT